MAAGKFKICLALHFHRTTLLCTRVYTLLLPHFLHSTTCLPRTTCLCLCLWGDNPPHPDSGPMRASTLTVFVHCPPRSWECAWHRAVLKKYLLAESMNIQNASWHAEIGVECNHLMPTSSYTEHFCQQHSKLSKLVFWRRPGSRKGRNGSILYISPFWKIWNLEKRTI